MERLDAAIAEAYPARLAGRLGARIVARLRPRSLDRDLIAGVDPSTCAWLAARARRLTSRAHRALLAATIRLILEPPGALPGRSKVRPATEAIRENETALRAIAEVLTDSRPVYARGMAMLEQLLSDGTGPVYTDRSGRALAEALSATRAGLTAG
jgi:hypothetical protein